nr:cell wall-binding repeat-containing protein [Thermococcus sp. P6]
MRRVVWKKGLAIVICLMFAFIIPHGQAASERLTILVSDNEADETLAYSIADLLGATVIVSPWGSYDPNATARIIAHAPDEVIIIGGPVAVPEEYARDLEDFEIPYERWYGETRYETNLEVIKALVEKFPEVSGEIRTAVVVNGRDVLAIRAYRRALKTSGKPIIVLTDRKKENVTVAALERLKSVSEVKYFQSSFGGRSAFSPKGKELSLWIRAHLQAREENVSVSPAGEEVYSLLIEVQNRTDRAERLLDGLQIPGARVRLERARESLEEAWDAYRSGDYLRAYELALMAGSSADFVVSRAYSEMKTVHQGSLKALLELKINRLEAMVAVLKEKGYDVSGLEYLLSRARAALERGDYSVLINDIMPEIRREMAELTRGGKHGRGGRPTPGP